MNGIEIKKLLLLVVVAGLVLLMPLFVFIIFAPLMISLWMTGIFALIMMRRKNPAIVESKRYQAFERWLYFQIINWSFGFFVFIPELHLIAIMVVATIAVLALNKQRRTSLKLIKWAKYVGFHIFNLALIITLMHNFPSIGEQAFVAIPTIVFINGGNAAFYLMLEARLPQRRRLLTLFIIITMMVAMTLSMFPQADGVAILDLIFGG